MYRQPIDFLIKWLGKANRKPLVIRGARQVGKTTLVRQFAKQILRISEIGRSLAQTNGVFPKHAIKQADRLLYNDGIGAGNDN